MAIEKTDPTGVRKTLTDQCPKRPQRLAVKQLASMATDDELWTRHTDPAFWKELANRWLRADVTRRTETGNAYLGRALAGLGLPLRRFLP